MALNSGECNEEPPTGEQGTGGYTGVHNTYAFH